MKILSLVFSFNFTYTFFFIVPRFCDLSSFSYDLKYTYITAGSIFWISWGSNTVGFCFLFFSCVRLTWQYDSVYDELCEFISTRLCGKPLWPGLRYISWQQVYLWIIEGHLKHWLPLAKTTSYVDFYILGFPELVVWVPKDFST